MSLPDQSPTPMEPGDPLETTVQGPYHAARMLPTWRKAGHKLTKIELKPSLPFSFQVEIAYEDLSASIFGDVASSKESGAISASAWDR